MQRFVLTKNIELFRKRLGEAPDDEARSWLTRMLADMQRELALFDARQSGVRLRGDEGSAEEAAAALAKAVEEFRARFGDSPRLAALYDPDPGLVIVDVNPTYERATGLDRGEIVGRSLFELFPDNPNDPGADGVHNLFASLRKVAETGQPDEMALQRYDVRDESGVFQPRYWRPVNTPIKDERGHLVSILHVVEEAPI